MIGASRVLFLGAGGFDPNAFGPAIGWWDAADAVHAPPGGGSIVNSVPNRIVTPGAMAQLNAAGTPVPTFNETGWNGVDPGIVFPGGYVGSRLGTTMGSPPADWTAVLVANLSSLGGLQGIIGYKDSGPDTRGFFSQNYNGNQLAYVSCNSFSEFVFNTGTAPITGNQVFVVTKSGNTLQAWRNGVVTTAYTSAFNTAADFTNFFFMNGQNAYGNYTFGVAGTWRAGLAYSGVVASPTDLSTALIDYYGV